VIKLGHFRSDIIWDISAEQAVIFVDDNGDIKILSDPLNNFNNKRIVKKMIAAKVSKANSKGVEELLGMKIGNLSNGEAQWVYVDKNKNICGKNEAGHYGSVYDTLAFPKKVYYSPSLGESKNRIGVVENGSFLLKESNGNISVVEPIVFQAEMYDYSLLIKESYPDAFQEGNNFYIWENTK
jgi:hypothetical protein